MKQLVVQQNNIGGWDVRESEPGGDLLYSSDRIRAEGYARQICAQEGGSVSVVGPAGKPLAEYAVKPWARTPRADPRDVHGGRRRWRNHP